MIDLVLRVETIGRDKWRIDAGNGSREFVAPLTDEDLRRAAASATPTGGVSILPPFADTWDGLLEHLRPNDAWLPGARIFELVGRLIHDHLIRGKVADRVHWIENRARAQRIALRYVVHVFEGEEDGLLPRLPFELMHRDAFWFRRPGTVGVRRSPESTPCDVHLRPGATVLVATAHIDGQAPSAAQLAEHVDHVTEAIVRAGFVARTIASCTAEMLQAALREGCDLLYLVCHGNEDLDRHGRLALRGGDVSGRQLGEWLEAAGDGCGRRVQAALLCACSSAVPGDRPGTMGMAAHLASAERRAVAALGFRAPIQISWGLAFMTQVFDHLARGASLEVAVARTRQAQAEDDPAWSLPLLFAPERDPIAPRDPIARGAETPLRSLLPTPPRSYFTARSTQLEALRVWREAPGAAVLTALAGEGGVGKTEIARKVAHEAHDAGTPVIWLERPDRAIDGSLTAMIRQAVPDYRPPDTATVDDLHAHMTRELGPRSGLLVLDDVEQAGAVATLTPGPTWNVLVTTRHRSLIAAVVEIEVEPLKPDDAVELLARVAQEGATFGPDEAGAARELVVALGCLPLAIELAGDLARRGVSLDEIRQATLSNTRLSDDSILGRVGRIMARSLGGLAPGDEVAWAMVAALPSAGATDQEVGLGLDEPEGRAGRRLFRLRQANLLRIQPAQARYTMHPLARQVAGGRARAAGTWDDTLAAAAKVIRAVAEWCVAPFGQHSEVAYRRWRARRSFFDTLDLTYWPPETAGADDIAMTLRYADSFRALERVPDERATLLDAALIRGRTTKTLAHVHKARGDLRRFRDDLDGAEADFARALELFTTTESNVGLADVHQAWGSLRRFRDDPDGAAVNYERALELYTAAQSNLGLANVHQVRGDLRRFRDDLDGAEADYTRALELFATVQSSLGLANVHKARGDLRSFRDDLDGAEADYACALELYTAVQDNLGLASVHKARGDLRRFRDDLEGATEDYARALELFTAVQSNLGLASVHTARGDLRRFRHDLEGAEVDYARALELCTAAQSNRGLANVHTARGELRRLRDDPDGAAADFARALELYTAVQDNLGLANVYLARGDLRFRDDPGSAEADYARALELFTAVQDNLGLANVYQARGDLHARTGTLDRAEGYYLDALPLYERTGESLGASNVLAELAQIRARLSDRAGARAYAQRAEPLARACRNRYAVNIITRVLAWTEDAREE